MQKLSTICNALNATTLKQLAILSGASIGTTKTKRIQNILRISTFFDNLYQKQLKNGSISVTSIDTGVSNFAIANINYKNDESIPTLTYWNKLHLEKIFRDGQTLQLIPTETSKLTNDLVKYLVDDPILRHTDFFTIEKQRTRTVSSRSVADPILKLNIMEHLIYNKVSDQYPIESSDPARMTKFWIPDTLEKQTQQKSKRLRIHLIKSIIFDNKPNLITLSKSLNTEISQYLETPKKKKSSKSLFDALSLQESINGSRKDDDLSDCLLHALAWVNWLQTYREIHQLLDLKQNLTVQKAQINILASQLTEYVSHKYNNWNTLLVNSLT